MSSSQIFISRLLRGMARGVPWFCILTCFALAVTGGGGTGMHRGSHPHSLVLPLRGLRGGGGGCKDASETDARRFIDSYTPSVYAKMRDDSIRTSAYKRALNALAPNRTVLDIGTGGLAILAISAAQAGAKRVYAIEASKGAYEQALEAVACSGFSDIITVVHGDSCNVVLPDGAKADIIVHEVLGEIASIEGVCRVVRDAQLRHLSLLPSGRRTSIPAWAASLAAPCEFPDAEYWAGLDTPVILPPGEITTLKLWHFPRRCLLSGWKECERLDFESPGGLPDLQVRDIEFECARDGQLAGFAVFMQASLLAADAPPEIETWAWDEEEQREVCRGDWAQQVLVLPGGGCHVSRGDAVRLRAEVDTTPMQPVYCYRAELRKAGNTGEWREIGEVALDKPNFG